MTEQEKPSPEELLAGPVAVTVEPDSRLEQLLAQYDEAKAKYEGAKERLDGLKADIKTELAAAKPNQREVHVSSEYLANPLRMIFKAQWRLDAKRLKAEEPETYVEFAYKTGSWYLEVVK